MRPPKPPDADVWAVDELIAEDKLRLGYADPLDLHASLIRWGLAAAALGLIATALMQGLGLRLLHGAIFAIVGLLMAAIPLWGLLRGWSGKRMLLGAAAPLAILLGGVLLLIFTYSPSILFVRSMLLLGVVCLLAGLLFVHVLLRCIRLGADDLHLSRKKQRDWRNLEAWISPLSPRVPPGGTGAEREAASMVLRAWLLPVIVCGVFAALRTLLWAFEPISPIASLWTVLLGLPICAAALIYGTVLGTGEGWRGLARATNATLRAAFALHPLRTTAAGALFSCALLPMACFFPMPLALRPLESYAQIAPAGEIDLRPSATDELILEGRREGVEQSRYLERMRSRRIEEDLERRKNDARAAVRSVIERDPASWLGLALGPGKLWAAAFALPLALAVPPALGWLAAFFVGARFMLTLRLRLAEERIPVPDDAGEEQWRRIAAWLDPRQGGMLREMNWLRFSQAPFYFSSDELVREPHVYIGDQRSSGAPFLLPLASLEEHAHVFGATGSGKTSRGLAPLADQLIRRRDRALIVVDLKGDPALLQHVRSAAVESGARFRWFTTGFHKHTHVFNPLAQEHVESCTLRQMAEALNSSLGLDHGEGYGRSFFGRIGRNQLYDMLAANPDIRSFRQLARFMETRSKSKGASRTHSNQEAIEAVRLMSRIRALNLTPEEAFSPPEKRAVREQIQIAEVVKNREVVYFHLPVASEGAAVADIARLVVDACFRACFFLNSEGGPTHRVHVFVDEFQKAFTEAFPSFIEQGRSLGLSFVLSNQVSGQMRLPGMDMRETILSNTQFKQMFTAEGEDALRLQREAGEAAERFSTMSYGHSRSSGSGPSGSSASESWSQTETEHEEIAPRLRMNDIQEVNADDSLSFCRVRTDRGFARFRGLHFVCRSLFHTSKKEAEARERAPFPAGEVGTIKNDLRGEPKFADLGARRRPDIEDFFRGDDA